MPKTIHLRNVPAALHRRLGYLAANAGMSLAEFLLAELTDFAAMPTPEEMRERLRSRKRVKLTESGTAAIRKSRDTA